MNQKFRLLLYPTFLSLKLIILSLMLFWSNITNLSYAITAELPLMEQVMQQLELHPYPEPKSGYATKPYKSELIINSTKLPKEYKASQYSLSSSIYYLLPEDHKLKFHATTATKQFHHYLGEAVLIIIIEPTGKLHQVILGKNLLQQQKLQVTIPGGSYVAAKLNLSANKILLQKHASKKFITKYALIGCTTTPSWEIEDCVRADYNTLSQMFPQHQAIIKLFT